MYSEVLPSLVWLECTFLAALSVNDVIDVNLHLLIVCFAAVVAVVCLFVCLFFYHALIG